MTTEIYKIIVTGSWHIKVSEISHFQKVDRSVSIYMKNGENIRLSEGEADGFMREFNKLLID